MDAGKKRNLVIMAVVIVALIVGGVGFAGYQHRQNVQAQRQYEERVHARLATIAQDYAAARSEKDDAKRLTALKVTVKAYDSYQSGDERDKQILTQYRENIASERNYFKHLDQEALTAATLTAKELADANREAVAAKHSELADLLAKVKAERHVIYSDKQLKQLSAKITKLQARYDARFKPEKEKKVKKAKANKETAPEAPTPAATSASTATETSAADVSDVAADSTSAAADQTSATGTTANVTPSVSATRRSSTTTYRSSQPRRWTPPASSYRRPSSSAPATHQSTPSSRPVTPPAPSQTSSATKPSAGTDASAGATSSTPTVTPEAKQPATSQSTPE